MTKFMNNEQWIDVHVKSKGSAKIDAQISKTSWTTARGNIFFCLRDQAVRSMDKNLLMEYIGHAILNGIKANMQILQFVEV